MLAQRLVRTLCEQCRVRTAIPAGVRRAFATEHDAWYAAGGCRTCAGSGYIGRTGVYELLVVDDATRDAIAIGASSVQVAQLAAQAGYRPMLEDAVAKVLAGVTTFDELCRVVAWPAA